MDQPCVHPHSLHLIAPESAALSGITQVLAFDDTQVALLTELGEICLTGQELHVTRLLLEDGQLTVEGRIDGVFYTDRKPRRRKRGLG